MVGRSDPLGLGGGGAMFCPAVSPYDQNLMFVSCDMGGLYRSKDGGRTWRMLDGRQMRGSIRCPVAFHPKNHDTVYAYGDHRGLRVSTNRGDIWKILLPEPSSGTLLSVTAIAVDPDIPNLMFYGTEKNGAFRSEDGGNNWTRCLLEMGAPIPGDVLSFFIDPTSPAGQRTCFFATRDSVFRSDNNGAVWKESDAKLPPGPGRRIRSFAGGANMNRAVLFVTVPSVKDGQGDFAGGIYRFLVDKTKEETWQTSSWKSVMTVKSGLNMLPVQVDEDAACKIIAQYDFLGVAANNPDIVYVAVCGTAYDPGKTDPPTHSGVYRSVNGGDTWAHVFYYVDKNFSSSLSLANVEGGWLDWDLGWGYAGPARMRFPAEPADAFDLRAGEDRAGGFTVCQSNPDIALLTNRGGLYITTNGGTPGCLCRLIYGIFNTRCHDWAASYSRRAPAQGLSSGPGQRWGSAGLEVTTTWHYYTDPHSPGTHYICYTDIGFARSEDHGHTWHYSAPTARPQGKNQAYNSIYELAIDPNTRKLIWAAVSDQHDIPYEAQLTKGVNGAGGVVVSSDGGKTWNDRSSGLPTITLSGQQIVPPVVSIILDPKSDPQNRHLWAALFGSGVYYSDNGGNSWVPKLGTNPDALGFDQTAPNLPSNMNVYRLRLFQDANTSVLFCSLTAKLDNQGKYTHPGGLWRSTDDGNTWKCITSTLRNLNPPPAWVIDYDVHPTNSDIVYLCASDVAGLGGGLYQTTDGGQSWAKLPLTLPVTYWDPNTPTAYWHSVFPFAPIVHPHNPDVVFVTTISHGIWVSSDGKQQMWEEFTDIPFMSAQRITFFEADFQSRPDEPIRMLFITTFGGGVWVTTDPYKWVI